jgi:hypothetical protein
MAAYNLTAHSNNQIRPAGDSERFKKRTVKDFEIESSG